MTRQRNDIFQTLVANGVDPRSCTMDDGGVDTLRGSMQIRHRDTGSIFRISRDLGSRRNSRAYRFSGNIGSVVMHEIPPWNVYGSVSWRKLVKYLNNWAREVRAEAEIPDLWAELKRSPAIPAPGPSDQASNKPFTPAERAAIADRLDRSKDFVLTNFELMREQMDRIEQRLDEVKEASTRVGRKDWVVMLNGTAFSLIVTDLVPPHIVETLLRMVLHGIAHIFGMGPVPPIITA